ncbi:MAG TPA: phytanoyl-CoA dioxygenase family protein [Chitinophagales bacterium]|nr:phytanoyl-CoA dioxygenase family protein [Chitinophagales bacterium]
MSNGIFINPGTEKQIQENGFAIIPFANAAELDELKQFYALLPAAPAKGTQVTMFNPSYNYRKMVDEKIKQVCAAKAAALFNNYEVLYTNFMVKEPGPEGDFPVHQDWTYVDETQHTSYALWIPTEDVDANNGALHVVKGSHKIITALRGPHVHEPFRNISAVLKEKYSFPVNLKAGEALVWDHRLVHFSNPNTSNKARVAFTLIMVPKGVEVMHCFGIHETNGTVVEKYRAGTEFYMQYNISQRPFFATLLETVEQPLVNFGEGELKELLATVLA